MSFQVDAFQNDSVDLPGFQVESSPMPPVVEVGGGASSAVWPSAPRVWVDVRATGDWRTRRLEAEGRARSWRTVGGAGLADVHLHPHGDGRVDVWTIDDDELLMLGEL